MTYARMLKIGATKGCKGCENDTSSHNPECIARFEEVFGRKDVDGVGVGVGVGVRVGGVVVVVEEVVGVVVVVAVAVAVAVAVVVVVVVGGRWGEGGWT